MASAHRIRQNGNAVTRWITMTYRTSKLNVIQLLPCGKLRWDWLPRCHFVVLEAFYNKPEVINQKSETINWSITDEYEKNNWLWLVIFLLLIFYLWLMAYCRKPFMCTEAVFGCELVSRACATVIARLKLIFLELNWNKASGTRCFFSSWL